MYYIMNVFYYLKTQVNVNAFNYVNKITYYY